MPPGRFVVRSPDGVDISVQKSGSGPALLLIHGALLNSTISWFAVMPKLAEQFTVYAMDRRGRAPSGDASDYSLSLEAGDIASVADSIGGPLTIVAHSYGALATLEAIPRLRGVKQLILYEPPVLPSAQTLDVLEKMDRALAANNREEIVTLFLREQIGAPAEVLAGFKASPFWPAVLQISPTLPRESRTVNASLLSIERLAECRIPAVMFAGSETRGRMSEGVALVCRTIPGCRLVVLEGQGHSAMMQAPDLFVAKLVEAIKPM